MNKDFEKTGITPVKASGTNFRTLNDRKKTKRASYFERQIVTVEELRAMQKKKELDRNMSSVQHFFFDTLKKDGRELRTGQVQMASEIMSAIGNNKHYVAEAGVGIGKSYAYLVPAVICNAPVIIATSTIALQEQLETDAKTVYKYLGKRPNILLLKGMSHYFCYKRFEKALKQNKNPKELSTLKNIQEMSDPISHEDMPNLSKLKERSDIKIDTSPELWNKICVDTSKTDCYACSYSRICHYQSLREKARNHTGITITNMNLLTVDLRRRVNYEGPLLSRKAELLIIDEAHNLESKVRDVYTHETSYSSLKKLINTVDREIKEKNKKDKKLITDLLLAIEIFFRDISEDIEVQYQKNLESKHFSDTYSVFKKARNARFLSNGLKELKLSLEAYVQFRSNEVLEKRMESVISNLREAGEFFDSYINFDSDVFWAKASEIDFQKIYLYKCPNNIAEVIKKLYFKSAGYKTVCVSATLTNKFTGARREKYSYFLDCIGYPDDSSATLGEPKPSPFPYNSHAMVYYAKDLPDPRGDRDFFNKAAYNELKKLIHLTKGRTLILFTSKYDMDSIYEMLIQDEVGYKILKQRNQGSQQAVFSDFKTDTESILLGTGSFWEGMDAAGETLSNLIVFRLPFPVPEPVIENKIKAAGNALDVIVPEMIIKMKQGVGRLIRTNSDTGIVAILDPRATPGKKPYSDMIWDALPIKNRTSSFSELENFWLKLQK